MISSLRSTLSQDLRVHDSSISDSGHAAKNDDRRFRFSHVQQRVLSISPKAVTAVQSRIAQEGRIVSSSPQKDSPE